jgi:hypothetical protein
LFGSKPVEQKSLWQTSTQNLYGKLPHTKNTSLTLRETRRTKNFITNSADQKYIVYTEREKKILCHPKNGYQEKKRFHLIGLESGFKAFFLFVVKTFVCFEMISTKAKKTSLSNHLSRTA